MHGQYLKPHPVHHLYYFITIIITHDCIVPVEQTVVGAVESTGNVGRLADIDRAII